MCSVAAIDLLCRRAGQPTKSIPAVYVLCRHAVRMTISFALCRRRGVNQVRSIRVDRKSLMPVFKLYQESIQSFDHNQAELNPLGLSSSFR
jgi:hypothetical protein